jgi:hypothetical protein
VLPRYAGCFRLETPGVPPVAPPCAIYPTDLQQPALLERVKSVRSLAVLETGRPEAPIVVAWPAQGGGESVYRVERIAGSGALEIVTLARRATLFPIEFPNHAQVFLDPSPSGEQPCYRVTQVSYLGEALVGEACLGDAPGPPDAGSGLAADDQRPTLAVRLAATTLIAFSVLTLQTRKR